MSQDFLLEIGVEEIPAGMVLPALDQLETGLARLLEGHKLTHEDITAYGTPRRLALIARDVAERQETVVQDVRGPKAEIAFDADGKPTKAAEGFARSKGASADDLEVRETKKGAFVYLRVQQPGRTASEILADELPPLIRDLRFYKTMRWANTEMSFARPLRWLVALLGAEVVPFSLEGVASGSVSRGHRFLHPGDVQPTPASYLAALESARVIADHRRRRQLIREQVEAAAAAEGLAPRIDDELLTEVCFLVEYPTAFVGTFDEGFLELPEDVPVTVLRRHQKYFPVETAEGRLANRFVAVRNGDDTHLDVVTLGAERVVRPRLADARFYYERDQQRPLDELVEDLSRVTYMAGLGSLLDKTERIGALVALLAERLLVAADDRAAAERAARLCKADLITEMVQDFASLQGIMGGEYARLQGEGDAVALAIREHYQPAGADDAVPATLPGAVLSLSDKIDNLAACFSRGMVPKGTRDPYALRRQAQGALAILVTGDLRLDLPAVLRSALRAFPAPEEYPKAAGADYDPSVALWDFILQRLDSALQDEDVPYDIRRAITASPCDDLAAAHERGLLLSQRRAENEETFITIVRAGLRPTIWRKEGLPTGSAWQPDLAEDDAERQLAARFREVRDQVRSALDRPQPDWSVVWRTLDELRPAIDRFFDDVFVMVDDERLRHSRLALCRDIDQLFLPLADFREIVIET